MVVKVFLAVVVDPRRKNEIREAVEKLDEVVFACLVESGQYDIIAMVEVDSLDGYKVLIEKVAALPHTEDFSSFITVDT